MRERERERRVLFRERPSMMVVFPEKGRFSFSRGGARHFGVPTGHLATSVGRASKPKKKPRGRNVTDAT